MKSLSFTFVFVTALLLSSCSTETTYTVEMIDGVRTVHNLKPMYEGDSKISLEFVRQIGEVDGDDENLQFYYPEGIDFDDDGNMYIMDRGNYRIQKLDPESNFILSFGKEGQGPGEFSYMYRMKIINNKVYVYDPNTDNIQIFSKEGEYMEYLPIDVSHNISEILDNGNFIFIKLNSDFLDATEKRPAFYIAKENGTIVQSYGNARFYDDELMKNKGNSSSYAVDSNNDIYQIYNSQKTISKFSPDGKTLIYFTKYFPFDESIIVEKKSVEFGGRPGTMLIWNQFYGYNAVVDHKNRLWILSRNFENDGSIDFNRKPGLYNLDVYSSEGILLQSIPWEKDLSTNPISAFEDKLYFEDYDDMTIYEYRIVEH